MDYEYDIDRASHNLALICVKIAYHEAKEATADLSNKRIPENIDYEGIAGDYDMAYKSIHKQLMMLRDD